MNRKQRRNQEKHMRSKEYKEDALVYKVNKEICRHKERLRQEVLEENIEGMSTVLALSLVDETNLTKEEIHKVLKRFYDDSIALDSGHLDLKGAKEVLAENDIVIK